MQRNHYSFLPNRVLILHLTLLLLILHPHHTIASPLSINKRFIPIPKPTSSPGAQFLPLTAIPRPSAAAISTSTSTASPTPTSYLDRCKTICQSPKELNKRAQGAGTVTVRILDEPSSTPIPLKPIIGPDEPTSTPTPLTPITGPDEDPNGQPYVNPGNNRECDCALVALVDEFRDYLRSHPHPTQPATTTAPSDHPSLTHPAIVVLVICLAAAFPFLWVVVTLYRRMKAKHAGSRQNDQESFKSMSVDSLAIESDDHWGGRWSVTSFLVRNVPTGSVSSHSEGSGSEKGEVRVSQVGLAK